MVKCTFCGDEIERGTGTKKIMKDSKVVNLCSTKCNKNMFKLKRVARETPWTAEYKAVKEMRMATQVHKKVEKKTAVKENKAVEKKVVKK